MGPLQSFQIPVEIFVIFLENEKILYCSKDMADEMNNRFNLGLSKQSVHKILKGLTDTDRLIMQTMKKPGMNVEANYYQLNPAIPKFPYKNLVKRQSLTRNILDSLPPLQFISSKNGSEIKETVENDEKEEE